MRPTDCINRAVASSKMNFVRKTNQKGLNMISFNV